jgi:broad specificity phosphatase PhoE
VARRAYTGMNMTGTPVRILLARHGETVFNVEGRWQGQSDSPLTERGIAQAEQLALALANERVAAVYASDLGRAFGTAERVAAPHQLQVVPDSRLREIDVGDWTGLSRAEIKAIDGERLQAWGERPATVKHPRGEGLGEAQARALAFFGERMPAHAGETIVVVTHGAIGQAIIVHAMGSTLADLWLEQRLDNCQISRIDWTPEAGLQLRELSDVKHLAEIGSLKGWRTTDTDKDRDVDAA